MNKSEQLYCELKNQLTHSEPGSPLLPIRAIMNDYDVSQVTVSSAIQRLAEEGLLRKNGRRGMEVTDAVLRYRKGARPIYCLALPLWPSEYYNMLEERFLELQNDLKYELDILHYDFHEQVPSKLPISKIDGLIVLASQLTPEGLLRLDSFGIPYLIFGQAIAGIPVNSVSHDEEYTGMLAAHHLWEQGHRKLAVLNSEPDSAGIASRIRGFRQFAELHDCVVEEIGFCFDTGTFTPEIIYRKLKTRFLNQAPEFTGIFVVSDSGAYAVCRACRECGIRIPDDIGLITCGEEWKLDYMNPSLSSIGSDHRELAQNAIELLRETASSGKIEQRTVKAQLFPRESTVKNLHT